MKFTSKLSLTLLLLLSTASSTLYSLLPNYTVIEERSNNELVYATYEVYAKEKGWNYLHIYANGQKGLLEQHRSAGYIEGYVTYSEIYSAYNNLQASVLGGNLVDLRVQNFVDEQLEYLESMINNHPFDIYWQYAEAYLEQMRYMHRGYLTRINREKAQYKYISFSQFYYLTNLEDIKALIPGYSQSNNGGDNVDGNSGYVKLLNGSLYIGHSTINVYQSMLRIFKTYNFPIRNTQIGSQWLSFSSRPGDLTSGDDFYILSSNLTVFKTALYNFDENNYKELSPRSTPSWLRKLIASNLAKTGEEWIDYYLKQRSHVSNSQWVIADSNKLNNFNQVITVLEEGFSIYEVIDFSKQLQEKGYVAFYNIPTHKDIYDKLGYQGCTFPLNLDPYTYEKDPRANDYAKYDKLINGEEDMKKWLLNNDNEDPTVGIAPRFDLASENSKPYGLTDLKIVSKKTLDSNYLWIYSGPSKNNGKFAPFDWTNWPQTTNEGMSRKWNFDWQRYTLLSSSSSTISSIEISEI